MNEGELRRLLASVAPDLPEPPDRLAAVARRSRHQRRLAIGAAAATTAVVLVGAFAVNRGADRAAGELVPGTGVSAVPSPTDSVLRTAGCATYPDAGPTEIGGTPVSGNSELTNELNNRIYPYATENFADVFAQPAVTDIGRLRVYRKPSAAFDAWIMSEFATDCVEIADAKMSAAEMTAVMGEIDEDAAYWRDRGIVLQSVGGDPVTGDIEISVPEEVLDRARREIPPRYPHLRITVSTE